MDIKHIDESIESYCSRVGIEGEERDVKIEEYYREASEELTAGERKFVLYYTELFNVEKAYKKAYPNSSNHTSIERGRELMSHPKIQEAIRGEIERSKGQILLTKESVIQQYIDLAFSDIFDIVEEIDGVLHLKQGADGKLIRKIKPGEFGVEVQLHDKMKALDSLGRYFGLNRSDFERMIELKKLDIMSRQLELKEVLQEGDKDSLDKATEILQALDSSIGGGKDE